MITRNLIPKGRRGKVRKAVKDGNKKLFGRTPAEEPAITKAQPKEEQAPVKKAADKKELNIELVNASGKNDITKVAELLDQGAQINELVGYAKSALGGIMGIYQYLSALHVACIFGCKETAELLIERGAEINLQDNNGSSALHHACSYGRREIVKILLEKNANTTLKTSEAAGGKTALEIAKQESYRKIVRMLKRAGAR